MKRIVLVTLLALLCVCPLARAGTAPDTVNLRRTVVVEIVARTKDAVVNISTTKIVSQRISPFANPFWEGVAPGEIVRVPANSLGSGFIIHPDGYVLTNNHVIDRARQITVELSDGRKLNADLISADPEADLAILKISDPKPFPVLTLGDSSDLMIGEPAIAVGNPLGYSHTVSTGIVSALHRDLKNSQKNVSLSDLIQTDAAINPGNSGGPLLNAYGQVIGINTAIRSDAQNIGFAIQVNKLRDLIPELMNPAQASKVDVPLKLMEKRTLTPPSDVACEIVSADDKHRVLKAINGNAPKDIIDAYAMLLRVKTGEKTTVTWSDGKEETILPVAVPVSDAIVQAKKRLGLTIEALTPIMAEKYHLDADDGLFVTAVDKDSIAMKAGLQAGDVVIQFGRYRVATLDDLSALMRRLPDDGQVRIGVIRGDQVGYGMLKFGNGDEQ